MGTDIIDSRKYCAEKKKSNSGLARFAFWKKDKCEIPPRMAYSYRSDERLKDIIGENLDAMDKINRLKVYDFTFKDDETKTKRVGVIAQELQKVFPNAVIKGKDGYLQIRHEDIFYAMVRGLQELDAKIKQLIKDLNDNNLIAEENKEAISELNARIEAQAQDVAVMRERLADLEILVKKHSK